MNKKTELILIFFIFIILFPIIFFPNSPELATFFQGAKTIAEGGRIYVDFIDLNPPFVYYLFVPFYFLFGSSEFLVHFLDFLIQLLTVYSLVYIIYKITSSKQIGYITAIVYALLYSGNWLYTFQIETLITLPLIWLCYLYSRHDKLFLSAFIGFAIGLITSIKYPFIIIIFPFIFDIIFDKTNKLRYKFLKCCILILFSILSFLIAHLPLLDIKIWKGFSNVSNYLTFYYSFPQFDTDFIKQMLKTFTNYFAMNISLAIVLVSALGFYYIIKQKLMHKFFSLLALISISMTLSIIIERKMFEFHFERLFLYFSLFSAVGFYYLFQMFLIDIKNYNLYSKLVIFSLVIAGLICSPFLRWTSIISAPYLYFSSSRDYYELFSPSEYPYKSQIEFKNIANFLNINIDKNDRIIIVGFSTNSIYDMIHSKKISKFANSSYYLSNISIPEWKNVFFNEVKSSNWLVLQKKHRNFLINKHNLSAKEAIEQWIDLNEYLNCNFVLNYSTEEFSVYKRILK